jgi:putative DNA primase/helicase
MSSLLEELKPIDFASMAALEENDRILKKHYVVISIEQILTVAKQRCWSLCVSGGSLYTYNGEYWKQIPPEELRHFLGNAAERLGVDKYDARHHQFRNELYKQFMSTAYLPRPNKKTNEVLINLKNGTFVITPDKQYLREFDRSDFMTYQLPFEYDSGAECPMFDCYLNQVLPDKERQRVLAEYLGYVFVSYRILKLEKALILFGNGANGKSVFFDIINALLGPENVSNYSLKSLTVENGYQRAKLSDKLLNYASEISPKMDSTIFKQLVSGEPIEARLPYKDPFILIDYAKFIFNTNILPKDVEQNEAFFRRFLLVEFPITIPKDERDPELAAKIIKRELAGVFNWVLAGLGRLLKHNDFSPSVAIDQAMRDYKTQSDSVNIFIQDERFEICKTELIPLKEMYGRYKIYCEDYGYRVCALRSFGDRLRNLGFEFIRHNTGTKVGAKIIPS